MRMRLRTGFSIRKSRQRGQVLVLFAIAATFLIAISGLAIEGGLLEADRRFEQAISDGAALAGAHNLPSQPAAARQAAANYAVQGLNGGMSLEDLARIGCIPPAGGGVLPLPPACDPSPPHTLTITTPYALNTSEILVKLDHTNTLNLAAVVGVSSAKIASRSVARSFSGRQPFGYTVYAAGDITQNGSADAFVNGNVYAQGCIRYGNSGTLTVTPQGSQAGSVELYNKDNETTQSWTKGSGTGCTANVDGTTGPTQWGAFGHVSGNENCGPAASGSPPMGFTDANCLSSGEPPVTLVEPPRFNPAGPTSCPGSPSPSPSGQATVSPGCYNACSAGTSGNTIFPNVVFQPGTYGFVGSGINGGCNVILTGTADGSGVTFYLYNGTSLCNEPQCNNSGHDAITLSAPTGVNDPNFGMLLFSCGNPCGTGGSGQFFMKGPSTSINLTGTVYNPGGDCVVDANAASQVLGQIVCYNIQLQGGSISGGATYGGNLLAIPDFAAELIE